MYIYERACKKQGRDAAGAVRRYVKEDNLSRRSAAHWAWAVALAALRRSTVTGRR